LKLPPLEFIPSLVQSHPLANAMIFLETDRLLFRTHELHDEDDFVAMHTDPEVRRYVGGEAWSLYKAVKRFRAQYLRRPTNSYGLWATILKENGKYVGSCGLANPGNGPRTFLGFYIARPYSGRGLASEAAKAFIEVGFARLHLQSIFADVEKGHAASEHILRKFGFHFVSEEEIPGRGRIISLYELLQSEWNNRTP